MYAFPGRIDTSSTGDAGFRVKILLDEERIEVVSHEGERWSWSLDEVRVQRSGPRRFFLYLGDERLYFTPDEPLGFMASPIGQAEEEAERRGWLRRRIEAARAEQTEEPTVGEVEWVEEEPPGPAPSKRRRHEHEWTETTSAGVVRRRCAGCGHVSIDATGVTTELDGDPVPTLEAVVEADVEPEPAPAPSGPFARAG